MKKCPFCAEEIQDEAKKCKHCGENIERHESNNIDTHENKYFASDVEIEKSWKKFRNPFIALVIITISFLLASNTNISDGAFLAFEIIQIILVIIVIIRAGKFGYLATKVRSYSFIGLWIFFPLPLINYAILYYKMNAVKKEHATIKKMIDDSSK